MIRVLRPASRVGLAGVAWVAAIALLPAVPAGATTEPRPATAPRPAAAGSLAASARLSTPVANARIAAAMRVRVRDARVGRTVGAFVWDVGLNRSVFAVNRTLPLLPASTMKIVTASVALQTMGPAARFPTTLRMAPLPGSPAASPSPTTTSTPPTTPPGTAPASPTTSTTTSPTTSPTTTPASSTAPPATPAVTARLTVVAGGDPLTSSADLRALARQAVAAVRAAGANGAELRLDDTLFPAPTPGPGWTTGYVPYVVRPVRPLVRDGRLGNDVAADAATYLATALTAAGLPTTYRGRAVAPADAAQVAMLRGHTVAEAVRAMMLPSDNQIAEMLFRLSARQRGRAATWANASLTAREVLAELRVPLAGVVLADGSGVSRADRLTAGALVTLLRRVVNPAYPNLRALYLDRSMPVAGRTGTLRTRFATPRSRCARGIVVAKTGTLFDVVSLAGVTTGADGRLKVFAFVVNRYPTRYGKPAVRSALDELAATVTGCT